MSTLNRIQLRTPENVILDVELAGIGNRALALALDYTVLTAALGLGAIGFFVLVIGVPEAQRNWLIALASLAGFVVYGGYFVLFETLWQGQTPGKRFTRIRVVLEDGRPIGLAQAGLRALLRPLDDLLYLGALCILFGKHEKRIGDWVAGTLVIQEVPPPPALTLSPQATPLAEKLAGQPGILNLAPADYAVLQQFLQQRREMDPEARAQLARRLGEQLFKKLALSDRSLLENDLLPLQLRLLQSQPQPIASTEPFLEAVWLASKERQ